MKWFKTASILILVYIILSLAMFPARCAEAAREALELCAGSVAPSLFPFFVCSSLLVALGAAEIAGRRLSGIMRPVFRVGGAGAVALILGVISGYPVGAQCASELYASGRVTKSEAQRLLAFCNNSGPLFIIGVVGYAMNGSETLGVILYIIHIVSAILSGIAVSRIFGDESIDSYTVREPLQAGGVNIGAMFGGAVLKGVKSILGVCGFVVFFKVAETALPQFYGRELVDSLLEITGGLSGLSQMQLGSVLKYSLISMFLAFSGLSVFLQVSMYASAEGLSMKPYAAGKFLQGIFAFVLTYLSAGVLKVCGRLGDISYAEAYMPYPDMAPIIPPLDLTRYLILIGGQLVWCLLFFGITLLISGRTD